MFEMETKSVPGLLTLTCIKGIGPISAERLASRFQTLSALLEADSRQLDRLLSPAVSEVVRQPSEIRKAIDRAKLGSELINLSASTIRY